MATTISDTLSNAFGIGEVGLTVYAYRTTDFGGVVPGPFAVPPAAIVALASAVADSNGAFALTLTSSAPVHLAVQSALNPSAWYWSYNRGVDYGIASSTVVAAGVAPSKTSAVEVLGQYNTALTAITAGDIGQVQLDKYGRAAQGEHGVNLLTHASAADTGVASSGTTTYALGDVSMFAELSVKLNITAAAGGSSPTVTAYVDLIDAQSIAYQVYASDAMTTTAGSLSLLRIASIGKGCTVGSTGVVQGASSSLAGCTAQVRIVGGGTTSNTSATYSLTVDGR